MRIIGFLFLGSIGLAVSMAGLLFGYFPFVPPEIGDQIIPQSILSKWLTSFICFSFAIIAINLMLGYFSKIKNLAKNTALLLILYATFAGIFYTFNKNSLYAQFSYVGATLLLAILILPTVHTVFYFKNKSL